MKRSRSDGFLGLARSAPERQATFQRPAVRASPPFCILRMDHRPAQPSTTAADYIICAMRS